jgi:undecaprenyl diphosphate synthase
MSRSVTSSLVPADLLPYIEDDAEARELAEQIDWTRLPRHVAIIMDGNGRWAGRQGLPRVEGHRAGITAVRETVETAARSGIETLTLYAFSVENWKRPQQEIDALMELLKEYLSRELGTLLEHSITFESIGRLDGLPEDVQEDVRSAIAATSTNDGMKFIIALNYGGRTEITDAVREALREAQAGNLDPQDLDESWVADHLYTAGVADPDLLIRTSGELRISNFMLFQIAYAEIWVTRKLWPDFRRADFLRAIVDFQKRERRYGSVGNGTG